MSTIKKITSKINAVKSRLQQIENSKLFSEEERDKLKKSYEDELQAHTLKLEELKASVNEQ